MMMYVLGIGMLVGLIGYGVYRYAVREDMGSMKFMIEWSRELEEAERGRAMEVYGYYPGEDLK